jgi:hypothetical protein
VAVVPDLFEKPSVEPDLFEGPEFRQAKKPFQPATQEELEKERSAANRFWLKKYPADKYSGVPHYMDAFAQGILPVRPKETIPPGLEEEHPFSYMGGKLTGYALMGGVTAGLAPATWTVTAPFSPLMPFLARAVPRMVSRSALWGGKELLDQTMRVVAGDDPSVQKLIKEPAKEALYGGLSGMASGVGRTFPRIAAQGAMRGLWVTGKALLEDGVIDKNDLINISTNAILGAAVEAINAPQISRAYKAQGMEAWENNWMRARITSRHPEYTPWEVDNAIGIMKAFSSGYKLNFAKPVIERTLKDMPEHLKGNPALKAAVISKFSENLGKGLTVAQAMESAIKLSPADLVGGVSSNILKPFEVPEGEPEQVPRPSIPVETVVLSPNEKQNYTVHADVFEDQLTQDVGQEKALEAKTQGMFDSMVIKFGNSVLSWKNIPQAYQRDFVRYVQETGGEGFNQYVESLLNQHVVIGAGGIDKKEKINAEVPVFYGPRIQWGMNPSANIEAVVTDMLQEGITPAQIIVQTTKPGDGEAIASVLKDEYLRRVHPKEEEKDVVPELFSDSPVVPGLSSQQGKGEIAPTEGKVPKPSDFLSSEERMKDTIDDLSRAAKGNFYLTEKEWKGLISGLDDITDMFQENSLILKKMFIDVKPYLSKDISDDYQKRLDTFEVGAGEALWEELSGELEEYYPNGYDSWEDDNSEFINLATKEVGNLKQLSTSTGEGTAQQGKGEASLAKKEESLTEFFKSRREEKIVHKEVSGKAPSVKKEPSWAERTAAPLPERSSLFTGLKEPKKPEPMSEAERERRLKIEQQQAEEIKKIAEEKESRERIVMEDAPGFLKGTLTNDMSKREVHKVEEEAETAETEEDVAEQERWQQGMHEQESLGRDISDYVTEARDILNTLTSQMEVLRKAVVPNKEAQLEILQGKIDSIRDWLRSIDVNNDIYSCSNGEIQLHKMFLNLKKGVMVGDAVLGRQVYLPGQGVEGPNGLVHSGSFRLIDIGNGKILVKDAGDSVTVFPSELLEIQRQGGEFTNEPNIAAGGIASSKVRAFDGKKTEPEKPVPGMREPVLRLRLILKTMELFGWDMDRVLDMLGRFSDGLIKSVQDPEIASTLNKEMEREIHLNSYAHLVGRKLEDDIRQYVRGIVEKERKKLKLPFSEKAVVDDIDSYMFIMWHAAPEVGALSSTKYFLTDQGMQMGFQPGEIQPDSERLAVIQAYKQATGQEPMPTTVYGLNKPRPGKANTLNIQFNPAVLQMMEQGTRPELLFFNMLPAELKKMLLFVKAEFENVHFKDMIDSGVMDRADLHALIARGYVNRIFKFADIQQKENYYGRKFLGSTDLPHAKYRTAAEYVLASGMGELGVNLIPIVDFAKASGEYARDAVCRTAQMAMINALKGIPNQYMSDKGIDPLGILTYEKDAEAYLKTSDTKRVQAFLTKNNYSELKLEGLVEYFHGAFVSAWVRNDLHELIKEVYINSTRSPRWINALIKLNGAVKRNIMFSPYQYILQIGSSPASWMMWGKGIWKLYIRPLLIPEAVWGPVWKRWKAIANSVKQGYGFRYGLTQHISDWDHITKSKIYDPHKLDLFMRSGLSVMNPATIKNSMYGHDILRSHPDHRTAWEDFWEFLAGKGGVDTQIFNHIAARLMYQFTDIIFTDLKKKGIPEERAAELAVDFSNRTSGLLDPAKWRTSAEASKMYQLFMFARDFTFSFMTQVSGATYPVWKKLHRLRPEDFFGKNMLLHADKDNSDMKVMAKYFRSHLARVCLLRMLWACLLQYALIRAYLNTPEGKQDNTITEDMQWAWNNWKDPGKFGMIATPWRDHQQRQIYIDPLLFREFSQLASIMPFVGGNVGRWMKGKASWVVNAGFLLMHQLDWRNQPVTDESGQISFLRRAKDVGVELAKSAYPTFIQEEPISSPAVRLPTSSLIAAGHPLKRSQIPVGKGESFESNKKIMNALGLKRYNDLMRQKTAHKPMSQGDIEELERLVDKFYETDGMEGISQEQLQNFLEKMDQPGAYMERKNQRAVEMFQRR